MESIDDIFMAMRCLKGEDERLLFRVDRGHRDDVLTSHAWAASWIQPVAEPAFLLRDDGARVVGPLEPLRPDDWDRPRDRHAHLCGHCGTRWVHRESHIKHLVLDVLGPCPLPSLAHLCPTCGTEELYHDTSWDVSLRLPRGRHESMGSIVGPVPLGEQEHVRRVAALMDRLADVGSLLAEVRADVAARSGRPGR